MYIGLNNLGQEDDNEPPDHCQEGGRLSYSSDKKKRKINIRKKQPREKFLMKYIIKTFLYK